LNGTLRVTRSEPSLQEVPTGDLAPFFSINAGADAPRRVTLKRYRASAAARTLKLSYEGPFDFGLADQKEEYTRGFRETAGDPGRAGRLPRRQRLLVSAPGPRARRLLDGGPAARRLARDQPGQRQLARPGRQGALGLARRDRRDLPGRAGRCTLYRDSAGAVEALAYLREKDDALAASTWPRPRSTSRCTAR
jgi:hypothetical protein